MLPFLAFQYISCLRGYYEVPITNAYWRIYDVEGTRNEAGSIITHMVKVARVYSNLLVGASGRS